MMAAAQKMQSSQMQSCTLKVGGIVEKIEKKAGSWLYRFFCIESWATDAVQMPVAETHQN